MKRLITILLSLMMITATATTAFAADYSFGTGSDTLGGFGGATSVDTPVTPDPMTANTRRNKDNSALPPPYFYGSGDIPTDPSSPYHNNLPQSGFVPANQDLPATGGESYAPGSSTVSTGFLPSTSQTTAMNTAPLFYAPVQSVRSTLNERKRPSRSTKARIYPTLKSARDTSPVPPLGTATLRSPDIIAAVRRTSHS